MAFTCPICDGDDFKDLDYLRVKRMGFVICKTCGFETYHPEARHYKQEEELLDFYRFEYRRHPNGENVITCNRKLGYLQAFLGQYYQEKKDRKFLDIGCAIGYFLNYLKMVGHPVENLYGTEYTVSFANFAKNFYGLKNITEEPNPNIQYDYIHLIHVLEHMHEPDKKLEYYRTLLKDDGYMLIAVPIWHDYIFDTAKRTVPSFEDLYHPNHINVWTKRTLRNLFNKTGWKVVKDDGRYYGYFVLCQKGEKQSILKEDYKDIEESTARQKLAIALTYQRKYDEALKTFANYPDAYLGRVFYDFKDSYEKGRPILDHAIQTIPDILDLHINRAHLCWQWKQYDQTKADLEYILKFRPNDDNVFEIASRMYMETNQLPAAFETLKKVSILNPARWQVAFDLIGNICAQDWSKPPIPIIDPLARFQKQKKESKMFYNVPGT